MSIRLRNADGAFIYVSGAGAGTIDDPYVLINTVSQLPEIPLCALLLPTTTVTSTTANTWTQVFSAKTNRVEWFVQNTSDSVLEIGFGSSGSITSLVVLPTKYAAVGRSVNGAPLSNADVDRIVVKSTGVSSSFIAWEVVK